MKIPLLCTKIILDTEENHNNLQAGYLVTRSTFEPGDSLRRQMLGCVLTLKRAIFSHEHFPILVTANPFTKHQTPTD
jgi:hypothetical protein